MVTNLQNPNYAGSLEFSFTAYGYLPLWVAIVAKEFDASPQGMWRLTFKFHKFRKESPAVALAGVRRRVIEADAAVRLAEQENA